MSPEMMGESKRSIRSEAPSASVFRATLNFRLEDSPPGGFADLRERLLAAPLARLSPLNPMYRFEQTGRSQAARPRQLK